MPFIPSLLRATSFSNPFLQNLVPSISLAFGLQTLVAVPSIVAQTERFYDLSGSVTYLSCTALSLYLPTIRARYAAAAAGTAMPAWPSLIQAALGRGGGLNWRQAVLSAAVSIWATRCRFSLCLPTCKFRLAYHYSGHLSLSTHNGRRHRFQIRENSLLPTQVLRSFLRPSNLGQPLPHASPRDQFYPCHSLYSSTSFRRCD